MAAIEILKMIPDNTKISTLLHMPEDLLSLLNTYNKEVAEKNKLTLLSPDNTGAEVKTALLALEPEVMIRLLYKYVSFRDIIVEPETPLTIHQRDLKYYALKTIIAVIGVVVCMSVGVISYIVLNGEQYKGTVVGDAAVESGEIIEYIFNKGKRK